MSAAIRKLEQLLSRVQTRRAEPRTNLERPIRAAAAEPARPHLEPQHGHLEPQHGHTEPQHAEPVALRPEMMRVPPPAALAPEPVREAPRAVPSERVSRPASTPLEAAMGQLAQPAPVSLSPTPVAKAPQAPAKPVMQPPAPAADDLVLDDFDDGPPTIRPPESFDAPLRVPTKVDVPKIEAPKAEPRFEPPRADFKIEEDKPTRVAPALPDEPPARAEPVKPTRIATAEPLAASPVATVSAARAFVPKSFGQLVERSLALRPRR